jgi:flagellar biosynthetic protein FlhB
VSQGGGEKTEKATPKKRRDARKKGQVRHSTEVNTTFCALIMFGLLYIIWPWFVERLMDIFKQHLGTQSIIMASAGMSVNQVMGVINLVLRNMLFILLPIVGTALIAGVAINLLQIGPLFTTKPLGMKLNRISPISGFKRMFSIKTIVDLAKSLLKICILGYIAYSDYRKMLENFPGFIGRDVHTAFIIIMRNAFLTALKMCLAMIIISILDYLYQWWKYEKDLRMTKQEVKDEYKMMEGDPQIKSKIKAKQRQMSAMRMMSRVPEADVVVTNPTHYAIALKYDDKVSGAPVVVAKGQDYLARKIKEAAIEAGVEIVENPPLAQSLYALCEVDEEIPAEFYQAVADILVFVYRQKGRLRK